MDAKEKRKEVLARNKKFWRIFTQLSEVRGEEERKRKEEEQHRLAARVKDGEGAKEDVVWTARTQEIRNRLTGQKRQAKERWNRFAGTSGGGGRGL